MVTRDAKSRHEQILDVVNQTAETTRELGIIHLMDENDVSDGRHIRIKGRELVNFGTCGYMGLEMDERLKSAVIDAVQRYGTAFASTRAYVTVKLYEEIEDLLSRIFGKPVVLLANVTLSHISNIPILVGDNDCVIMDTQVHDSVQTAVQLLKSRNVHVDIIRHNRVDILEDKINKLKEKYNKIWYMPDGIYSMFGDGAPMKELYQLMDRYEQFHVYVDDTHGMSWTGKNGSGYVLSEVPFHDQMILVTSLNKAFSAAGGVTVFPNEQSRNLVRNCGRPFIFSGSIHPPMLGASIASAKIHLSPEIYTLQKQLHERVKHINERCDELELPLIFKNNTPIFFIGVSKPSVAYSMVKRLINRGYFFNLSVFPSVAINNAGLRIPVSRNHSFEDINGLLENIATELPFALREAGLDMSDIYKAFRMENPFAKV